MQRCAGVWRFSNAQCGVFDGGQEANAEAAETRFIEVRGRFKFRPR